MRASQKDGSGEGRPGRGRGPHDDPSYWAHEVLGPEEVLVLARRARQGDRGAREELVLKNQRLVLDVAKRYVAGVHELGDLVSAGNRGLIRAVAKFDPERGKRFSTYAGHWIRHFVRREVQETGGAVHVPIWVLDLAAAYRSLERRLRGDGGEPPGFGRVCAAMGLPAGRRVYLEAALRTRGAAFGMVLESDAVAPPPPPIEDDDGVRRADVVRDLVARLPHRQAEVVRLHFGLGETSALTLTEIARREGRKYQAIQRTKATALAKLRRMVAESGENLA